MVIDAMLVVVVVYLFLKLRELRAIVERRGYAPPERSPSPPDGV